MLTPDQYRAIFDFETIFPVAMATVLQAFGITVVTQANITKFQTVRPRCECIFKTGPERQPRQIIQVGFTQYNAAYTGTIAFSIITDTNEHMKEIHAQWVSQLRALVPVAGNQLNGGTYLPNHKLQWIRESGTTLTKNNEEGYWVTSLSYDMDFSIQKQALESLAT